LCIYFSFRETEDSRVCKYYCCRLQIDILTRFLELNLTDQSTKMACKGRLAEFILHITNLVYFSAGIAFLVVGALGLDSPSTVIDLLSYIPQVEQLSYIMYLPGLSEPPAIYMTVIGSLVIVLSFVGCGGAFKRNKFLIMGFGLITLLMMIMNIAFVMYACIDPYYIEGDVIKNMNKTLVSSFKPMTVGNDGVLKPPSEESAKAWVTMQAEQSCCGVNSYKDYEYVTFSVDNYGNAVVPPSCCMQVIPGAIPESTSNFTSVTSCLGSSDPTHVYRQGCLDYVMAQVTRYGFIATVSATGLTGLQAIILCLTMWLLVLHLDKNTSV